MLARSVGRGYKLVMLSGRPPEEPKKTKWLAAVGACVALVAIPLVLWALIDPSPKRPAPQPPTTEPVMAPQTTDDEPVDGLRLVAGTVVDEEGAGVAAVAILIEGLERIRTVSDNAGRFTLSGVPLDAVTLLARGQGFEEGVIDLAEGDTGDRETVEFVLEAARGAEGVVLDAAGEPVERAMVSCGDGDDPTMAMNTDGDGHFSLSSKAVGCEAVAKHPDYGDSDPTELRAGDDNTLRLKEPASISGYVTDERGQALSGVSISIERFVAASGSDSVGKRGTRVRVDDPRGEFTLSKLQAGTYVLSAVAEGRPPAQSDEIEVANGEQVRGVRIEIAAGATLSGRIIDADSGEPIDGARVWLDALTMTGRVAPTTTSEDGSYELDGVPEGPFSVAISAEGYTKRVVAGIETRGATALSQDFELTAVGDGPSKTEYSGIGAMLAQPPEGLMIGQVVEGGPSEEAGLQARDLILRIDGRDTSDMTVAEAVQLLRGESGSRVSMAISRDGEELDFVITRGTFTQ